MPSILEDLPAFYGDLLPSLRGRPAPVELKATCASCAMAETPPRTAPYAFRVDTKCCTFHPQLPNYLVGSLLSSARSDLATGRARMEARLALQAGASPQWLRPTRHFASAHTRQTAVFGRAIEYRCPFLDVGQGTCTIWPFRETVCSTYFCKYVHGIEGYQYWQALRRYLALVESQLSRWAMSSVEPAFGSGTQHKDIDHPIPPEQLEDQAPAREVYDARWGAWAGREAPFYRQCFEAVHALEAHEVTALLGSSGVSALQEVDDALAATARASPPTRLRLAPSAVARSLGDGSVSVTGYNEQDALVLSATLFAKLRELDGSAGVEALELEDSLLLDLWRHRILVEP